MCPEKDILSAFFDGELDERFVSMIEAHLSECDSCREILAGFEDVRTVLHDAEIPDCAPSKRLAWSFLSDKFSSLYPRPVWKRRLLIPAPAMAAVLLLVLVLGAGLMVSIFNRRDDFGFDTVTRTHFENVQFASFEQIIEYLDARGNGGALIFTLPQDTRLQYLSEPTFIKAADYKRGRD
ncbi:MAG: zf-HC2 domain-containing protein [Spirochaetales bacterium]|nr:zf-HC2 domain-containing protein [Spirochaetales bacterium]